MKALYIECAKAIDGWQPKTVVKLDLLKEADILKRNHDIRFQGIPTK